MQEDGKYGFVSPCTHSSLTDLVVYYSDHNLVDYDPSLKTPLLYPVNVPENAEVAPVTSFEQKADNEGVFMCTK